MDGTSTVCMSPKTPVSLLSESGREAFGYHVSFSQYSPVCVLVVHGPPRGTTSSVSPPDLVLVLSVLPKGFLFVLKCPFCLTSFPKSLDSHCESD